MSIHQPHKRGNIPASTASIIPTLIATYITPRTLCTLRIPADRGEKKNQLLHRSFHTCLWRDLVPLCIRCTYNHIHVYIHQVISNRLLVLRWYYNVVQLSYTRVCMVYTRTLAVLSIPSHTKQRSQGTQGRRTHTMLQAHKNVWQAKQVRLKLRAKNIEGGNFRDWKAVNNVTPTYRLW